MPKNKPKPWPSDTTDYVDIVQQYEKLLQIGAMSEARNLLADPKVGDAMDRYSRHMAMRRVARKRPVRPQEEVLFDD